MVSSTPRPHLTPGKDPAPILQEAGWAPGPVWTDEKTRPHRDSIPDRPARRKSLYRLSYRAHKQLEGENIIHDQKKEGGSSQKEQPAGIKTGGKMQKLTAVDVGRQYWDCVEEIGNKWRRRFEYPLQF